MEDTQKQILGALEKANNVLVTVRRNPSVDQLSAAIGLTLALNKLGKHAIAVFSGEVPSTIEFLQPDKTLEKNTDSLRDFIIALDKNKADKLRYKVEDDMVKIFITPYKTSLSQDDLEFSQGDFNVEVVMALGVHDQSDLDQAITAHGRILHDATVVGVTVGGEVHLGSVNWVNPTSSSLSEMLAELVPKLKENILDNQIATAFLTGIVAETQRFSNEKTSPGTMQISSQLMAAGANQQLVATQLEQPVQESGTAESAQPADVAAPKPHREDGALEITHDSEKAAPETPAEPQSAGIHIDEHGQFQPLSTAELPPTQTVEQPAEPPVESPKPEQPEQPEPSESSEPSQQQPSRRPMALTPPVTGGKLTANIEPEGLSPSIDVLGDGATRSSADKPLLPRRENKNSEDAANQTLSDIEKAVSSPHLAQEPPKSDPAEESAPVQPPAVAPDPPVSPPEPDAPSPELSQPSNTPPISATAPNPLEDARNAVMAAMETNSQPDQPAAGASAAEQAPQPDSTEVQVSPDGTLNVHPPVNPEPFGPPERPSVTDASAPPEVPPPFMPPNYPPENNGQNQQ